MLDLARLRGRFGRRVDLPQQVRSYRRIPPDVLSDLAEFCGAMDPAPLEGDQFKQGRVAGRRDVWLRIQQHCCLDEAEIYALLKGQPLVKLEG